MALDERRCRRRQAARELDPPAPTNDDEAVTEDDREEEPDDREEEPDDRNEEPDDREEEAWYLASLEHERHMFAWCLMRIGGRTPEAAAAEAAAFYVYEPASKEYRALVFHDLAWDWAMLTIHGDGYWQRDRALETPTAEYEAEASAFCAGRER